MVGYGSLEPGMMVRVHPSQHSEMNSKLTTRRGRLELFFVKKAVFLSLLTK